MQRTGAGTGTDSGIEVFEYPVSPAAPAVLAWDGFAEEAAASAPAGESERGAAALGGEFERQLAEEVRGSFEAGREQGRKEGRQAEREAQAAALAASEQRRAQQAATLIESFAAERDRYLRAVEHEVVELALAVAARILRREAQMDPLLLTGAVRVALGQLSASTEMRLRVPPADLAMWTDAMALLPNLHAKPRVEAGEGLRLGECVVETALGSVDLGIRSQLGEIERGFFDRTGSRKHEPAEPAQAMAGEAC